MASVKTAVSIPRPLFDEVEALAGKLGVSRSRLYARALEDYVEHHENERLLEKINSAYAQPLDAEERELFGRMKRYQGKRTGENR
jgi:metal-responsive CopG/Arc/MetJ family transcriptional regulator